jgi:osmotically-inducible protein OsmY
MKPMRVVVAGALLLLGVGSARAELPAGTPDRMSEEEIQRKLRNDPDLKNNQIDVKVEAGVATLRGTVDSPTERAAADSLARVRGVMSVDDQLRVDRPGTR